MVDNDAEKSYCVDCGRVNASAHACRAKVQHLRWAAWPFSWNRCRAVKEPNSSGHWGRCELYKHEGEIDHALERGMNILRWTTRWTS